MSVVLFIREIGERYRAVCQGQNAAPRPLALQYGEYARRQRAWIGSPECSAALAWWKESLAGDLAPLDFATDFPRPPMQTYRGAGAHALLDAATLAQLRALSRQHGSTLYMTLLAAFKALLYRYTGTHDLIVGSPVANRDQAELQDVIGMFVNTVALRSDLSGNPGFTELLQRVRETCLGAFRHQDVPFGLLLEELRPPRDLSRTPLFQVLFNLLPVPVDRSPPVAGLAVQSPPIDHLLAALDSQSKYDLTLYAQEQSDGLLLMLVYNADLFAADRMTAFLGHYTRLIHAIAREPRARIGDIQLEEPRAGRPAVAHVLAPDTIHAGHAGVRGGVDPAAIHRGGISLCDTASGVVGRVVLDLWRAAAGGAARSRERWTPPRPGPPRAWRCSATTGLRSSQRCSECWSRGRPTCHSTRRSHPSGSRSCSPMPRRPSWWPTRGIEHWPSGSRKAASPCSVPMPRPQLGR